MAKRSAPAKRPARTSARRAVVKRKASKRKTAARAAATRARKRKSAPKPSRLSAAAALARGGAAAAIAAIARRLPWSKGEHDPIVLLETDHRRFQDLLKHGEE